jgi:hypothetical protein
LTIGRATSCNVAVESAAVSKVHARILRSADQVTIQIRVGERCPSTATHVSVMVLTDKDRVGLRACATSSSTSNATPAAGVSASVDSVPGVTATVFDQSGRRLVLSTEEMQELEAARQQL